MASIKSLKSYVHPMKSDSNNDIIILAFIGLCVLGVDYLRNGPPRWLGFNNGGNYLEYRTYCDKHPSSKMRIDGDEISCSRILELRDYCSRNPDGTVLVMNHSVDCDDWMGLNSEQQNPGG
jgi:hypothetical protein